MDFIDMPVIYQGDGGMQGQNDRHPHISHKYSILLWPGAAERAFATD
jgi:hypothetical protein